MDQAPSVPSPTQLAREGGRGARGGGRGIRGVGQAAKGGGQPEGRVIAYASRHLKPHEKNYPVHDLKLPAIVHALKTWRHYLYGVSCEDRVQHDDARDVTIGDDGVLRMQSWICVPNVDGLWELILEEAHSLRYSIHPGAAKMYQDLRQYYWWRRMKKDIAGFVDRCLNCQQVKYEHQRLADLLQ
ncbi:uncharacterized protein [Nicotiana sylvestris]|uniref:uncharacterized protein n=1 Tax=Nicotiana sylvestris TaxID=4096 RepID=UPI00388C4557